MGTVYIYYVYIYISISIYTRRFTTFLKICTIHQHQCIYLYNLVIVIIFAIIKKHIINPDPEGGDREFRDNLHGTDYLVGHQWLASLGRTHAPTVSHCNVHVIGLEGSWEDVWFDH